MKFITYLHNGNENIGVLSSDGSKVIPCSELGLEYDCLEKLASSVSDDELSAAGALLSQKGSKGISMSEIKLLAPIPHPSRDIICLGVNFHAHALESVDVMGADYGGERKFPIYFAKHVNEAVAPGDNIDGHFDIVKDLDYEVEMALVVRKDAKQVKAEDAG